MAVLVPYVSAPEQPHFLGAVILKAGDASGGSVTKHEIIDGQQRLTTLQILIAALRDFAKMHNATQEHQSRLHSLTINRDVSADSIEIFKVWPTNVDRESFSGILKPESKINQKYSNRSSNSESKTAITKCYYFFLEKFENKFRSLGNRNELDGFIDSFLNAFRRSLSLVFIGLGTHDDPQLIFETMNARGQPLLTSDLIKNYIFRNFDEKKMEDMYVKYWQHFDNDRSENNVDESKRFWYTEIRQSQGRKPRIDLFVYHYLIMKTGKEKTLGRLYQEFKLWFDEANMSPDSFLEDFCKFSRLYRKIIEPTPTATQSRLEKFCYRLKILEVATIYPLLLFLSDIETCEVTDMASFNKCIESLESYVVRRFVCGYSTNRYNLFFPEVLSVAKEALDSGDQESMFKSIVRELIKSSAPTSCWPTDQELQEHWLNRKIYVKSKANRTVMILDALQRQMSTRKNEGYNLLGNLTVEHLLPQKADLYTYPYAKSCVQNGSVLQINKEETKEDRRARLIHTIGNLTLITQSLNSGISNGPFTAKAKAIVKESDLRINAWLREEDRPNDWDEASILKRGLELFEEAKKIWPAPQSK